MRTTLNLGFRRLFAALVLTCCSPIFAQNYSELTAHEQLSEDILREIIGIETTERKPEENLRALEAMAQRLRAAGFPEDDIEIVNPSEGAYGLVARYRGKGSAEPIAVLAHIDVVPAAPFAWSFAPFELGIKDGYYVGRGTADNKTGVTQIISNFVRLKREGWVPERDVIAAITGDEETTGATARWLANEGKHLVDAEFAINSDAGGGQYSSNRERVAFFVQTSEKLYHTFSLTASNPGGHSSVPRPDNAIAELALAITRLQENPFPIMHSDTMKMSLKRSASLYPDDIADAMRALADDANDKAAAAVLTGYAPYFNAQLRTTCTPTMLSGGHAENALPRRATATVNCRIWPGVTAEEVESHLAALMEGLPIEIGTVSSSMPSPPSVMPRTFLAGLESLVEAQWEGVPIIPSMSTGATDGLFYRNAGMPVYGISGVFGKPGEYRAHGLDEKVGVREFHESVSFWYRMLRDLAGG